MKSAKFPGGKSTNGSYVVFEIFRVFEHAASSTANIQCIVPKFFPTVSTMRFQYSELISLWRMLICILTRQFEA